jgi:hypothetical protein
LLERLRVWLNAEDGASKNAASSVIVIRFKMVCLLFSGQFVSALVGIVPETNAAVRMTPKDRHLVV